MKVQVKISPTTIIELEGKTVKEVFEALAGAAEIFGQDVCGICNTAGARPTVRHHEKYTYYEMRCVNQKCGAKLGFGQPRDNPGGLFPQRKDKLGAWKANRGWEKYERNEHSQEPNKEPQDYSQEAY